MGRACAREHRQGVDPTDPRVRCHPRALSQAQVTEALLILKELCAAFDGLSAPPGVTTEIATRLLKPSADRARGYLVRIGEIDARAGEGA